MKDGRTHLAHKAEHAIDLDTGAIVGITVQGADEGDTTTIQQTLPEAAEQLEAVAAVTDDAVAVIEEVVADKGYHSRTTVHDLETLEIRTYISEPDRGPQSWTDQEAERDAVYANRRRIRGTRGKRVDDYVSMLKDFRSVLGQTPNLALWLMECPAEMLPVLNEGCEPEAVGKALCAGSLFAFGEPTFPKVP